MSMIQEYLEERKHANPTPPKSTKTYNRFFWWRRYQEHKFLPNKSPIWDKAKNGDYDVSPYWKQRDWEYWFEEQELIKFRKDYKGSYQNKGWEERGVTKLFWERRKRLLKDAEKDEHNRWALFIKDVKGSFGGTEEGIKEMFESFEGTMIEFLTAYRDLRNLPKIQSPPKF